MNESEKSSVPPKNKRVALIFITLKDTGRPGKTKAVIHFEKRGNQDGSATQKWNGVLLPTFGCKVMPHEEAEYALMQGLVKKYGSFLTANIYSIMKEGGFDSKILIGDDDTTVYGLVIPKELIDDLYPKRIRNNLVKVTRNNMSQLVDARQEWKHQPPNIKNAKMVFSKHREAVLMAIKKYCH